MGREIRRVAETWEHPKDERGKYVPLFEGDVDALQREWDRNDALWRAAKHPDQRRGITAGVDTYAEWHGPRPKTEAYMPTWSAEEQTHFQMYENTSEGTPLSPVMESCEALARWLADNRTSIWGRSPGTYEEWLAICGGAEVLLTASGRRVFPEVA